MMTDPPAPVLADPDVEGLLSVPQAAVSVSIARTDRAMNARFDLVIHLENVWAVPTTTRRASILFARLN